MISAELHHLDIENTNNGLCKNKQVLVMGLLGVGKTAVVEQLQDIGRRLPTRKYDSIKQLVASTDFTEVCDFYFRSFRSKAIHNADAIVLIYTVDDIESFDYITMLLTEIAAIKGNDMPVVVVANKVDTGLRKIHPIVADCVVTIDFECSHVEASAERGDGMKQVFSYLLQTLGEKTITFDKEANSRRFRQSIAKRMSTVFRK